MGPRALPIVEGTAHLGFRCSGCGVCCSQLRVAVTHHDLRRLVAATNEPLDALVAWLGPDEVDMTNEPGSFVELRAGRRLMVLAQRDGACRLLDAAKRCRAYAARPLDCRQFPFDFDRVDSETPGLRLSLAPLAGCDHAHDGRNDAAELVAGDARRWQELTEYQELVQRWNRLARHLRRMGRAPGDAAAFLRFVGFDC